MKKTFHLITPNKTKDRQVDAIKSDIKKYLGRERRKKLPDNADFWDFDCKIGPSEQNNEVINCAEIRSKIDFLVSEGHESFYLEILAKPAKKLNRKTES